MDDCVMGLMPSCIHILCHVTAQFRPLKERWLFPHAFTFSSAIRLVLVTRIRKRKHGATFERRSQKALYASFFPICAFAVSSACPGQLGAPRRADRWHRWELCAYNVVQSYPMSRASVSQQTTCKHVSEPVKISRATPPNPAPSADLQSIHRQLSDKKHLFQPTDCWLLTFCYEVFSQK